MATAVADLTESQIATLLQEAEERLTAKNSEKEVTTRRPFQFAVAPVPSEAQTSNAPVKEVAAPKKDNVGVRIAQVEKKKDKVRLTIVAL